MTPNTVRRLGHVLQPFYRNVNATADTLPVRAVLNPNQGSTHTSRLGLDVPATVFSRLSTDFVAGVGFIAWDSFARAGPIPRLSPGS